MKTAPPTIPRSLIKSLCDDVRDAKNITIKGDEEFGEDSDIRVIVFNPSGVVLKVKLDITIENSVEITLPGKVPVVVNWTALYDAVVFKWNQEYSRLQLEAGATAQATVEEAIKLIREPNQ